MFGSFATCSWCLFTHFCLRLFHSSLCTQLVSSFTWQCVQLAHLLLNIVSSHLPLYKVDCHPCTIVYSWLSFVFCGVHLALTYYCLHLTLIHILLFTVISFTCHCTVDCHSPAFIYCWFSHTVHGWLSVMPCCMQLVHSCAVTCSWLSLCSAVCYLQQCKWLWY